MLKNKLANRSFKADNLSQPLLDKNNNKKAKIIPTSRTKKAAKWIILALRHIAPPVVYLDSPLSYMSEGAAKRFYQGEVKNFAADPSVIVYYAIQTQLEDAKDDASGIYLNKMPEEDETKHNHIKLAGSRLVGIIPCSDAFGVDLLIEKY